MSPAISVLLVFSAACVIGLVAVYFVTRMDRPVWYVRYLSGHRTYCMRKKDALNYKAIYGGTLHKK